MVTYNKLLEILESNRNQRILLVLYVAISSALFFLWTLKSSIIVGNNDNYIGLFEEFIKNGWYTESVKGSSLGYNFFLYVIYKVTGSINASFFILNLLSQIFIILIGLKTLSHFVSKKHILISQFIIFLFFFRHLMLESYNKASNDTLLGVFITIALYIYLIKVYDNKKVKKKNLFFLGISLGIAVCIRPTSVFLIFILLIGLLFWKMKFKIKILKFLKLLSFVIFPMVLIVSSVNYPSLKDKKSLSFYNKNDIKNDINWSQRNYLALQKIESSDLSITYDNIWSTKFSDVKEYIDTNGQDSLPNNLVSSIIKNPIMYIKLIVFNLMRILAWIVRHCGLLFLIPIISTRLRTTAAG